MIWQKIQRKDYNHLKQKMLFLISISVNLKIQWLQLKTHAEEFQKLYANGTQLTS